MLEYRGFNGSACFDPTSGRHFGMVLDVVDGVVYESYSLEGLVENFETAVDEYIYFQNRLDDEDSGAGVNRPVISIVVRRTPEASAIPGLHSHDLSAMNLGALSSQVLH